MQICNQQIDDAADFPFGQRLVQDDLIQTVQEFRTEPLMQQRIGLLLGRFGDGAVRLNALQQRISAEIRGQNQNRVLEIDGSSLGISNASVVEHLQQQIEHIRVRFLYFIEQHDAVRLSADGFGQLTALLVSDISGRRADQTADAEFFHILGHINADQVALVVKQRFSQRFCKLRLTDTGRTEEQERADRPVRILNARTRTQNCFTDLFHGFILTDHTLMQRIIEMQQLFAVALHELGDRDSRPARHDSCDFILCDGVTQQLGCTAAVCRIFSSFDFLLQFREFAVLQLCSLVEVILPFGVVDLSFELFHLRTQLLDAADAALFVFPLCFHLREFVTLLCELLPEFLQMRCGYCVGFLFQRSLLNLQLHDFTRDFVHFGRHGIHFRADHRAGLVHQVDRLIRQEPVGDIAVRERRRCNQRGIVDLNAVEHLIALFQAAEDRDGILNGRLTDLHRLEPALQCGVLFNVFAVLIQRRRADAVQFTAGEHRLQQIACVHGAVRFARTDDRVQLVDKQQDLALGLFDLLQDRFQTLLKFTAVLCARDQCAEIEREDCAVPETVRDIAACDSLGKSFCDCGFADARLTDQNRVVLRFPGQNPDDIPDLGVTADDRIELMLLGALGQILTVFFQHVIGCLRGFVRNARIAADFFQCSQHLCLRDIELCQQLFDRTVAGTQHGEEHMLHGDILILHLLGDFLRLVVQLLGFVGYIDHAGLSAGAGDMRQRRDLLFRCVGKRLRMDADSLHQLRDQTVCLLQKGRQNMNRLHGVVLVAGAERLRILHGFQCFLCHTVCIHDINLLYSVQGIRSSARCFEPKRSENLRSPSFKSTSL